MLCILNSTAYFLYTSPVFYPYIASDLYYKDNTLQMKDFYVTFLFMFIGFPIGTFISKYIVNIFGIIDCFLIVGLLYVMKAFIFYIYKSLLLIFVMYIIVGI